jgi:hypothetical protein
MGDRNDPHAQIRTARSAPLLLHSLSLFRELFEDIYAHRKISTVVEIGVESGQVSGLYADLGASHVYCIDPFPSDELRGALAADDRLELVEQFSPDVLGELPVADLYVIDGDHNYETVRGEVDWILRHAPDAVVVFHDLLWPWGRRDLYYQPTRLGDDARHPDSEDGPTVWQDGLTPAGFVGLGSYTSAREAGGERNGVLTAAEDALTAAGDPSWQLEIVPAVFGVGVLVRRTDATAGLLEAVRKYSSSRLLGALENNRIALYTRVLQMQYDAVAHAANADLMAETIATQQREIDRLAAAVATAEADRDDARAEARAAAAPPAAPPAVVHRLRRVAGRARRRLAARR